MSLPRPETGLVIRYSYLWLREHRQGRYGTLICDLDRRCIVDLLPDREPGTVAAWLTSHTGLEIVARDRGGGYARAAAHGAPQARQVADRWHLMENASAAFLSAVRRCMSTIRKVVGVTVVDVALLTSAERLQYDGYCRRREAADAIRALARAGTSNQGNRAADGPEPQPCPRGSARR